MVPNLHVIDPMVSIIICSYNRQNLISQTIDSILRQNCDFKYEIIIGDDASSDNVRGILLKYKDNFPEKFTLVFHKKNIGLGANWASCVKLARGKYIAGCDNDDYWHNPDKLRIQVEFLEKNCEIGMVHTNYRTLNSKNCRISDKIIHNVNYKEDLIQTIFSGKFQCCNSSVIYRKFIIDKFINLDDYISYQFPLQDWNTWISIANFTKFFCLPISTTTICIDNESITRPRDYSEIKKRLDKEKIMFKYLCDKFPKDLKYNKTLYDRYTIKLLMSFAFKKKDYSTAKKYAKKLKSLGSSDYKIYLTYNRILFVIYCYLNRFKKQLL